MPEERALWEACNRTELYQRARQAGLLVRPNMSRTELIDVLCGVPQPRPTQPHHLDEWRVALAQLAIDYRTDIEPQLKCPLKSFHPRECFNCPDVQVTFCVTDNTRWRAEIAARKRPNLLEIYHDMSDSAPQPSVDGVSPHIVNAARNLAALTAMNTFQRRNLANALNMFETPEQRSAFVGLTNEGQAKEVLDALLEYDTKSTGRKAVATPDALPPIQPAPASGPVPSIPEVPIQPRPVSLPPPPTTQVEPYRPPPPGNVPAAPAPTSDLTEVLRLLRTLLDAGNAQASENVGVLTSIEHGISKVLEQNQEIASRLSALEQKVDTQTSMAIISGAVQLASGAEAFGWSEAQVNAQAGAWTAPFVGLASGTEPPAEPVGKAAAKEGKKKALPPSSSYQGSLARRQETSSR